MAQWRTVNIDFSSSLIVEVVGLALMIFDPGASVSYHLGPRGSSLTSVCRVIVGPV